ncbi:M28 family metallopeptidase [Parasediminibacterium sp. JCM 36343]|uniref:M28 family metallopeptidase n=1 Tax=Parasediminibacterium sp. JCM 36343 TaxID=3374279 RepID=UPI003979B811
MRMLLIMLACCPLLLVAQSKRKKALLLAAEEAKDKAVLTANIKAHLQYFYSDSLAGLDKEMAITQYLIAQYKKANIGPAGNDGYIQEIAINEGREIKPATQLVINGRDAIVNKHFFPLAFSASKTVASAVAMSLNEPGKIWFKDVKDWLEDNPNIHNFNMAEAIKKHIAKITAKGATALFLYNSGNTTDSIQFVKTDTASTAMMPIVYITREGLTDFFKDETATQKVSINVDIGWSIHKTHNVIGYINNGAANTVIVGSSLTSNPAGTAGMIEISKLLSMCNAKNNNYLFVHSGGEDAGQLGSQYWLQHPTIAVTPNYMVDMDGVASWDTTKNITIGGCTTSPIWGEIAKSATNPQYPVSFDSSRMSVGCHACFYKANMPVLFFIPEIQSTYGKAMDINIDKEREALTYILKVIAAANDKGKLGFNK